jgi:hypothetical protein
MPTSKQSARARVCGYWSVTLSEQRRNSPTHSWQSSGGKLNIGGGIVVTVVS